MLIIKKIARIWGFMSIDDRYTMWTQFLRKEITRVEWIERVYIVVRINDGMNTFAKIEEYIYMHEIDRVWYVRGTLEFLF